MSSPLRTLARGSSRARTTVTAAGLAGAGALSLVLASPIGAAAATSGSPAVTNRETVQVELSPTGKVDVARLFSQLTVVGDGKVQVIDPTSTSNLRNLDGFSAPSTHDGDAVWNIDVHGRADRRTVSDFDQSRLPLSVEATYTLDGKQLSPSELVGKSGHLEAQYVVKNLTATPTDITFTDGKGKAVTKTVDVVTPFVGQLQTTLPASFRNLDAPRADLAGDGRGGNQAVWTMVLFTPIGETTQTFGWSADVKNLKLPAATVQAVPVPPERKPELKFGQDGFAQGADTGAQLTDGAAQIDANLIKLRDGASQLLGGLVKLQSGALALKTGLAGQALPGAQQLSAGLTQAHDGTSQFHQGLGALVSGADQVSGGADELSTGLGDALDGATQIRDGNQDLASGLGLLNGGAQQLEANTAALVQGSQQLVSGLGLIAGGLAQLNDATTGLPAAKDGALALQAAVAQLQVGVAQAVAGIGDPATAGTLLNGMAQISGGLGQLADPAAGLPAAKVGVDTVKSGLDGAVAAGGPMDQLAGGVLGAAQYVAGAEAQLDCAGVNAPACALLDNASAILSGVSDGLATLKTQTASGAAALGLVSTGLADAIGGVSLLQGGAGLVTDGLNALKLGLQSGDATHPGVTEGLAAVAAGLDQLVTGLTAAVDGVAVLAPGSATAYAGAQQLDAGLGLYTSGVHQLAGGLAGASDGAGQLAAGSSDLANGLDDADSGAQQLAAGAQQLADGAATAQGKAGELDSGLAQLDAGGKKLAGGLGDAASGAGQLADGAGQAKDGAKQITDGAQQLHQQGTSQLVQAGNETTMTFGEQLARMKALDAKAESGALPYGAPSGSVGNSAAYTFTLAAATGESSDSGFRGLAAVALLAVGSVGATVLRRRVALR